MCVDESSTAYVNRVCRDIQILREEILDGHDRADHLLADIQALATEAVSCVSGEPLGLLLMRLRWQLADVVEIGALAAQLRITPGQLRALVEARAT